MYMENIGSLHLCDKCTMLFLCINFELATLLSGLTTCLNSKFDLTTMEQ